MNETLPLTGKCILITRARSQAPALAAHIEALGGKVWEFPVITILDPPSWAPLDAAVARLAVYRWLVITSPNGAERFAARLAAAGKGPVALAGVKVAAVGPATARALAAVGIAVDLLPAEARGAALPAALAPHVQPGDRILMARADLADPGPAEALRAMGCEVDDLVAYRTVPAGGDVVQLRSALRAGEIHYVTLTSSSTVNNLLERLGGREWLESTRIAVMGPETKKAALAAGLTVHVIAEQVSLEGLVNAIVADLCGRGRRPGGSPPAGP
ncbi:MAG TPA: uroporphyrinogen-III synthase [Symbiobacteriaceae bacterium]|nr:uroporphyrinogen-III synthase [Symbiobacteriaceae bacterium]